MYDERYIEFVQAFNERDFYECHELLEDLWLDDDGPDCRFYQGMIHLASAYLLLLRGKHRGSLARFTSTLDYLASYPDHFLGLDVARVRENVAFWLAELGNNPRTTVYRDDRVPVLRLDAAPRSSY